MLSPTTIKTDVERRTSPTVWREWDAVRESARDMGQTWPAWCYVPMAAAHAVARGYARTPIEAGQVTAVLQAAALWRPSLGIYRFAPELAQALVGTPLTGELPADVLQTLPEWCVYIETPHLGLQLGEVRVQGAWVHLEHDTHREAAELRLVLHVPPPVRYVPVPIHLAGGLRDGIEAAEREAMMQAAAHGHDVSSVPDIPREAVRVVASIVSLALYLCTEEPDLGDREPPAKVEPRRSKRRREPFLQGAEAPVVWETGFRLAEQLRAASEGDGGGTVRPHVRRAHWHTYWVGSEQRGDRRRELRWLSPMLVGGAPDRATVRKVE